jgi:hypothetical protein
MAQSQPLTINQRVVQWANGQLRKQVGKGECWDLAEQTFKRAGAETSANGKLDANGVVKTFEQHVKPLGKAVQSETLYTRDVPPIETHTIVKRANPGTKRWKPPKSSKR